MHFSFNPVEGISVARKDNSASSINYQNFCNTLISEMKSSSKFAVDSLPWLKIPTWIHFKTIDTSDGDPNAR